MQLSNNPADTEKALVENERQSKEKHSATTNVKYVPKKLEKSSFFLFSTITGRKINFGENYYNTQSN